MSVDASFVTEMTRYWREAETVDRDLTGLVMDQHRQNARTLGLIASSSPPVRSAMVLEGSVLSGVTAEGYPGRRYHSGAAVVDLLEETAITRACEVFGARSANVQAHSGSSANLAVLFSVLNPGATILSMSLDAGGHLTHGAEASVSSRFFNVVNYGVDPDGWIDYEEIRWLAGKHRPKIIICGASSYARQVDFSEVRAIADQYGALMLADISHISGLVVAGLHPNPIDDAHFVTTSTYKQLRGPRGGLILTGSREKEVVPSSGRTVRRLLDRSVFPGFQGTPNFAAIAAKASALRFAATDDFAAWARRIIDDAQFVSTYLKNSGYSLVTGGTDTHMLLVDLRIFGRVSGRTVEEELESCGVLVNRNSLPGDKLPPNLASGLRIGVNELAARKVGPDDLAALLGRIERFIRTVADMSVTERSRVELRTFIGDFCESNPISS